MFILSVCILTVDNIIYFVLILRFYLHFFPVFKLLIV